MKNKKLKELLQTPLRFHHQDLHEELEVVKSLLADLTYQVIELRKELRRKDENI